MSMQGLSPERRGCRFSEETGSLTFHEEYSRTNCRFEYFEEYSHTNCRFECAFKKAVDRFNCSPWYLPPMAGEKPCR